MEESKTVDAMIIDDDKIEVKSVADYPTVAIEFTPYCILKDPSTFGEVRLMEDLSKKFDYQEHRDFYDIICMAVVTFVTDEMVNTYGLRKVMFNKEKGKGSVPVYMSAEIEDKPE